MRKIKVNEELKSTQIPFDQHVACVVDFYDEIDTRIKLIASERSTEALKNAILYNMTEWWSKLRDGEDINQYKIEEKIRNRWIRIKDLYDPKFWYKSTATKIRYEDMPFHSMEEYFGSQYSLERVLALYYKMCGENSFYRDAVTWEAAACEFYSRYNDNNWHQYTVIELADMVTKAKGTPIWESIINKNNRNMKKRNVSVNESMSVTDYENKIKNLGSSDELKNILIHEYDLPTEKEVLAQCIKEWLDYQDYVDDPRGYDVALAYYYATYGDDEVFQEAVENAVQNMCDKGFVNENKNNKNRRKTFENFRNMKKNKKVTYRVNENSQRKRFKRLPMFENYLEEKYDSVKLLDGHKYVLTDDVVADDGQTLAKKGDTVTYEDVVGVFTNNATEFTTDCGVFRTEDGQALCPEILMSQGLVSDPQSKMTEDPKAFMAEVVAECRKVGQKLSKVAAARKKIYESLTDEQKKKYQAKKDKLTQEQIEKYNKEIDDMEEKALKIQEKGESGEISEEEMLNKIDRLTKSALEKYRIVTGGEDPAWYEEYMDEPGFGKTNESLVNECNYSTILLSENDGKVDAILKFCADNGFELTKEQLANNHADVEVAVDAEGDFVDFRVYDPNSSVSAGYKNADGWSNWMLDTYEVNESEEATETEVEDVVNDDILTPETVEAVLTADDDVKDETVTAVVDAVKDDAKEGEEISLDEVVDATVDAELSKEDATTVIDAVVDAVVDQKVEEETVNESKKRSLKKAVKESLHKKFRKGVFEARVMKIRNKKK